MRETARFIADTLALYGVRGDVEGDAAAIVVRTAAGRTISIERGTGEFPWLVRAEGRDRPCGSVVGVLNALRRALDVDRGTPVRVVGPSTSPLRGCAEDERSGNTLRAERQSKHEQAIPVTVLTGFLGSGKTTLLGRLLRHPDMSRTAVIVNEFGEMGLDHDLIETSDESFVRLTNGCLCCNVRSDLTLTLSDLAARRRDGAVPPFERVVIETTGLAEPAPILHALMTDRDLSGVYALDGVVTTVDATTGAATFDVHEQSRSQAAVADRLILTKTDLVDETGPIRERLAGINPEAPVLNAQDALAPSALFGAAPRTVDVGRTYTRHLDDIETFSLVREEPLHGVTLALFLSAVGENVGGDLLRMKGIVAIAEQPDTPAVIHGVQHVYHAPEWLERWPSGERRTRIVFIGKRLPKRWLAALLEILEEEVSARTADHSM